MNPPEAGPPACPADGGAWLTVARIVKTQGRRGEVAAEILTDFPERLAERDEVWLWDGHGERRAVGVERAWFHKSYVVFQLAGYGSMDAAKPLIGLEVQIPRAQAAPLGPQSFFLDELEGCRVVESATGEELGRVREVVATGGTSVLAVETTTGSELLIPFAEEFCRRIAPTERRIEVVLPEGLRDLNP